MKNYHIAVCVLLTSVLFFTGFKKDTGMERNSPEDKASRTMDGTGIVAMPARISIANVRAVKGDKGQRPVEVMVSLSEIASTPVTVDYRTKDRSASAGYDYVAASGSITFAPGETLKRISVFVIGEVAAEADADAPVAAAEVAFEINLSNVRNAVLENSTAIITIIRDILGDSRFTGGNRGIYEVRLTHIGYTAFHGTLQNCPIRSNGTVVLTGLLSGIENVDSEDDIEYRGTLQLDIDMDICSVKEGDPPKLCNITVTGSGPVEAVLEILYDGRGGYIKIRDTTLSGFRKNAVGTCDQAEIAEERTMIPLKTIATIFNGRDLPQLTDRTLRVGRLEERDGENVTVVEVIRKLR